MQKVKPDNQEAIYIVKDLYSGELENWTLEQVLHEINRDRSDTWSEYNESDWKEGWSHWIEGDGYYSMVEPSLTCTYPFHEDE